jgi:hypothetical protein
MRAGVVILVVLLAGCAGSTPEPPSATTYEKVDTVESGSGDEPAAERLAIDVMDATFVQAPRFVIDGFELQVRWVGSAMLGEHGDTVAPPGRFLFAADLELINPLSDRRAIGAIAPLQLQLAALKPDDRSCRAGREAPAGDGTTLCLFDTQVVGDLDAELAAGETRPIQLIATEPVAGAALVLDDLLVAARAGEAPAQLQPGTDDLWPLAHEDRGASIFGTLRAGDQALDGVRVVAMTADRYYIDEAVTDVEGGWEITGLGGEVVVSVDVDTLPDGVFLRIYEPLVQLSDGDHRAVVHIAGSR